jgi:hypothetical protein
VKSPCLPLISPSYDGERGDSTVGLRICTDSFEVQDIVRLMNVLMIRYGLTCTLHLDRGRFRVYINKSSSVSQLIMIVKPYMVPSMLYKLGLY